MNSHEWRRHARCSGMDTEVFFPLSPETVSPEAEAACSDCPVRLECADWAVSVPEKYGTWGGMTPADRVLERRRRVRRGELVA